MDLTLEGRPVRRQPLARFLIFGLVVVLASSGLIARHVYLQIVNGSDYAALAEAIRTVLIPIPTTRGLIYDRNGAELVRNVATYSVRIRPGDLSVSRRPEVVARLAALLSINPTDINIAIDSNPGSNQDLVRIASDIDPDIAKFISESRRDLPGVEIVVESRRDYTYGPLVSQILGYTAPITAPQYARLSGSGYQLDDLVGQAGVESVYEQQLRGTYGSDRVERDASGRILNILETVQTAVPGDSLRLTIDEQEQEYAQQALLWGMSVAGLKRGVVIVMDPQTGEVLALVSLPTYDDNLFARGISSAEYTTLVQDPGQPLLNHAISGQYPPGSTYKLVTGSGGLAEGEITAKTKLETKPFLTLGQTKYYEWNRRGWGACDIYCGFGHSSDTFFFQVAGKLGIDRLAHWAHEFGFGATTGVDLPGEVAGIVPSNQWKLDTLGASIYPGETYQAGIGQGYDAVTPLQLINAYAALANGGTLYQPQIVREVVGPDGTVVRPFEPKVIRQLDIQPSVLETMRRAARNVVLIRHTYNLVDMPIVVAGKSGTAEFGLRDAQGRLPFHSWFVAFVPRDPTVTSADPGGLKAVARTDAGLVVLAFAYDSGTKGNAATEIVKAYLQLHYGIQHDYRNADLLERGNFYQSP